MGNDSMRMQGVAGLRVVEIGERLSGAYAGLILAAQGAMVCQVRHGLSRTLDVVETAYFDRGRWLVDGPVDLMALIRSADLLLCDLSVELLRERGLPLCSDELEAFRPGLVMVTITSMGITGPQAEFAMEDVNEWAAGGLAYVTRRNVPDDDNVHYAPVLPPNRQAELLGGIAAATGSLAGLRLAAASGEAVLVDVSRQEVQAAMLHGIIPPFVWNGT